MARHFIYRGIWLVLMMIMPWNAPAHATDATQSQLERLNNQIEKAKRSQSQLENKTTRLKADLAKIKRDLITHAQTLQNQETVIIRLEGQLQSLNQNLSVHYEEISLRYRQISGAVRLYHQMDEISLPYLLMRPEKPEDIMQGLGILSRILPKIGDRSRFLNQDFKSLATIQHNIEQKIAEIDKQKLALGKGREALETLVEKNLNQIQQTQQQKQVSELALRAMVDEAKSISDLLNNLQSKAPSPPPMPTELLEGFQGENNNEEIPIATISPALSVSLARPDGIRPFPEKGQKLASPIVGSLLNKFGTKLEAGSSLHGIEIRGRKHAQIIAPFDGKIAFAGKFRLFGNLIIIEHDGGYHSVLGGFERINVIPEQWVLAGEPLGNLADGTNINPTPKLYVEIRKKGVPIDPLPFFNSNQFARLP